ncbi:MAG: DUF2071 domain-containing protein [Armatimonadetes bacterium]|nr:DUF2071 domain-containing protein [Armatimonadota bacterium]CUU38292.1 hypothetical protein DCOP10_12516 [Armatimonadetes bacterium DC]
MATTGRNALPPIETPAWRPALTMRWRHLLFVHWRVNPAVLRPLIPHALEIDTYDGSAWVGWVPFVMESVRPTWLPPVPRLFDFGETNVRTYVRYGTQRGVWFFSLDAAHRLAVWVARQRWRLPYYYARIRWNQPAPQEIHYECHRTPEVYGRVRYRIEGEPAIPPEGSLEHFLVERYTLFTVHRGQLYTGHVAHIPYRIQPAHLLELEQTMVSAAGIALPDTEPIVFYAPGFGVLASAIQQRPQA